MPVHGSSVPTTSLRYAVRPCLDPPSRFWHFKVKCVLSAAVEKPLAGRLLFPCKLPASLKMFVYHHFALWHSILAPSVHCKNLKGLALHGKSRVKCSTVSSPLSVMQPLGPHLPISAPTMLVSGSLPLLAKMRSGCMQPTPNNGSVSAPNVGILAVFNNVC
jgi:hypothetical protein